MPERNKDRRQQLTDSGQNTELDNARGNPVARKAAEMAVEAAHRLAMADKAKADKKSPRKALKK